MDAMLRRQQPGEKCGARRRTHRVAAQGAREADALRGKSVDVRRADVGIAVAAERPRPLVVGEDEDEIRRTLRGGDGRGTEQQEEANRQMSGA